MVSKYARKNVLFMQDSIDYGQESKKEITEIVKTPKPRIQQQLRSFLVMVNYYRKFLCNLSDMCAPSINCFKMNNLGHGAVAVKMHLTK